MAVKIRLRRLGRRKRPVYGVVAADSRSPRDGRFIEDLGRYSPLDEPTTVSLNDERVLYWLSEGAEPSDTVRSILSRHGLMLALHLKRKGSEDEEVWEAVKSHRERHAELAVAGKKTTVGDRRQEALKAEYAAAATAEAAAAKARAEADAKAKAEADAARQKAQADAQAERDAAAAAAKAAQGARNVEQASEDAGVVAADTRAPESGAVAAADPEAPRTVEDTTVEQTAAPKPEAAAEKSSDKG